MLFALRYILNASQNNHSKSIQADKLQCAIENGKRLTIHKNSKRARETDGDRDIKNILPAVSKNFNCIRSGLLANANTECACKTSVSISNAYTHTFDERSAEHNKKIFKTVAILWLDTDIVISIKIWILLLPPPPWCSCFHVDLISFFVYLDFIIIWELASLCWFFLISCELYLNFVYEQSRRCFWKIASFAIPNRTTHIFFVEQMRSFQTNKYLTNQLMHGDKSKAIVSTISYATTNATACITELQTEKSANNVKSVPPFNQLNLGLISKYSSLKYKQSSQQWMSNIDSNIEWVNAKWMDFWPNWIDTAIKSCGCVFALSQNVMLQCQFVSGFWYERIRFIVNYLSSHELITAASIFFSIICVFYFRFFVVNFYVLLEIFSLEKREIGEKRKIAKKGKR